MYKANPVRTILYCTAGFLLAFFISKNIFAPERGWRNIVTSDGRGYYAYLPAFITFKDPSFTKVIEVEKKFLGYKHYDPEYIAGSGHKHWNKYFSGEALLLLPFYLAGNIFSLISGNPIDGYSFFYQLFAGLGSLFYLFFGLIFLSGILARQGIRPKISALIIVLIFTGTNLLYYTIWQPTMSHVFSFFAINGFLWYTARTFDDWKKGNVLITAFFLGIVCLIRPTNALVILLVPFIAGNIPALKDLFRKLLKNYKTTVYGILVFLLIIAVQPFLWYLQTGKLFLWSYESEGFRFASPEIFNVLYSFRKGLFIYTPLIFISWLGLIILLLRNRLQFFSMLIFIVSSTYVISSWWSWYYGDGFGLRAFIDYYGIFAILLAILADRIRSRAGFILMVMLFAPFVLMNLFQTWQYTNGVIQPNSMSREKYKHIFMRADSSVMKSLGGNQEIPAYNINMDHPVLDSQNNFEDTVAFWDHDLVINTGRAFSGNHAGYTDSLHQYSPGLKITAGKLGIVNKSCYVEGELMILDNIAGAGNHALVVLSLDSINGGEVWWRGFSAYDIPVEQSGIWRECTFSLMLPVVSNPHSTLKVYIWNTGRDPVLTDDFKLRIYREK